jgi:periplasmic nitrate reductase NapD
MQDEVHIAGVIVHTDPSKSPQVRDLIQAIPLARIHAAGQDGRMVVTLETDSTPRTLDYMDAIRALPGVLNVALVYQHAEPLAAMDEEIE